VNFMNVCFALYIIEGKKFHVLEFDNQHCHSILKCPYTKRIYLKKLVFKIVRN
jgi:hypothetical protein